MNNYVTGSVIKAYREKNKITQEKLADMLFVSSKTVSKWENGNGFPDVTLLEPLAKALGVSLTELFNGSAIENSNRHCNMNKVVFYVCPVCGNVITAVGDACVSCHGITLPKLEREKVELTFENVEDEVFVKLDSPMTKDDYISFICGVYADEVDIKKLYPEGEASARLKRSGLRLVYYYDIKDGLFYSHYIACR